MGLETVTEDSKKGNATPRLLVRRLRRLSFITPLGSGRVAQRARPVLGAEGSDQQTADSQRPPEACGAQWAQCQSQPKPKSSTGLQKAGARAPPIHRSVLPHTACQTPRLPATVARRLDLPRLSPIGSLTL